ncbi:hypothetical protein [Citrobacter rodentium]|jgi:hypothetical protein|uniref:Exported protein n=2 Tax=Citrobacter rodentium TaxID=67825 RepID=D2TIH1_CITRI|nr:hypothetical protein [Citrobacter rodentium]KIQ51317.1 hypothetical protein TA05_10920 [Citrobacter rodentium]QBY28126.1 hypothetical protein E2R62_04195 [Citrobacter rodentium]UHO29996.1 hypothetical protein K7R23_18630 [Citrobacter rodentium NBRC 105723 = DSM 16636]CBG88298.1 putative exported protein [Citrobacter rodentium ICC168]HAT8011503.1 hypothetical protein [Citrobacter rodentium NBRC 105723 = DSM 16636]
MNKKKSALLIVIALLLGGAIGYTVNSMTVSKYNTINTTCTLINVVVDNHIVKPEQVVELGRLTKEKLGDSQSARAFSLSDEQIKSASESSNCSQFMVGMNQP